MNDGCSGHDSIDVSFAICTGLADEGSDLDLFIYPNPASDYIIISVADGLPDDSRIEVFDCVGLLLMNLSHPENANAIKIDISALASGVYYVRLYKKGMVMTAKFMVS